MHRFPDEFDDLLNRRGRKLLSDPPKLEALIRRRETPILLFEDVIDEGLARECIHLLDEGMYPALRRMYFPIPREALLGMTENYSESLRKTVRSRTATFNSKGSKGLDAAREIGLAQMLRSKSFLELAQSFTVPPLKTSTWGRQVICYETGDYSGPHNDHHPERPEARNGFIDLHVMFTNDHAAHQLLVYERRGFLSAAHTVTGKPAIAVYRLPFWHYTTPLAAHPGREAAARRWLLLGSFDYDPPLEKLEY